MSCKFQNFRRSQARVCHNDPWSCVKFQTWRRSRGATLVLEHIRGDRLFVDCAGDPTLYTDRTTGLEQKAWLFVAVWPYSARIYVEATRTRTSMDWLGAHVRALEAFGCAPPALVPDNCTTARAACARS